MALIKFITVGSLKEDYLRDAVAEYEKRLSGFCRVEQINLKEAKLPQDPSESEIKRALDEEAKQIIAAMPDKSYKIAMCVEGKQYDFILANINRNILIADMPRYAATLRSGGELYMSGILERDVEDVRLRAAEFGIEMDGARFRNGWAVMRCVKR